MISYRFDFIKYTKLETFEKVFIINKISIEMIDKKIVNFIKFLFNNDEIIVQLQKILHIFQLSANLFSTTYIVTNLQESKHSKLFRFFRNIFAFVFKFYNFLNNQLNNLLHHIYYYLLEFFNK